MKRWLLSLVLCLLPSTMFAAAPDVTLPDMEGKPRAASEFIGRGQWTVVAVWSVDCLICQDEIPYLAFFHDEHKRKDAMVLGLTIDGMAERARVQRFIDDHALGFPNLIGESADVARFGAGSFVGTPTYLIFTPKGKLVSKHVGAMDPSELERRLEQLQSGKGVRS